MKIYVSSIKGRWIAVTPSIELASRIWDVARKINGKFVDVGMEIDGVRPGVFIMDRLPAELWRFYVSLAPNHPILQDPKLKRAIEEL
jgi:hypothetical protein